MKKFILIILSLFITSLALAQNEVYDPETDAIADIKSAIHKAKKLDKNVFVKVGGNWCSWCKLYAKFTHNDEEIMKVMNNNYEKVLVNWSKENKNTAAMEYLQFPQRFGFPVFVIIDSNGKIIHIQNSAFLENDKGYDKQKVLQFLNGWTPQALDPETYKK